MKLEVDAGNQVETRLAFIQSVFIQKTVAQLLALQPGLVFYKLKWTQQQEKFEVSHA